MKARKGEWVGRAKGGAFSYDDSEGQGERNKPSARKGPDMGDAGACFLSVLIG